MYPYKNITWRNNLSLGLKILVKFPRRGSPCDRRVVFPVLEGRRGRGGLCCDNRKRRALRTKGNVSCEVFLSFFPVLITFYNVLWEHIMILCLLSLSTDILTLFNNCQIIRRRRKPTSRYLYNKFSCNS